MSAPPSLIGTTLDAYEIHALLGSGGMATVYRGFDVNPLPSPGDDRRRHAGRTDLAMHDCARYAQRV